MSQKQLKNLTELTWLNESEILWQVRDQFEIWYDFVEDKREEFKRDLDLFNTSKLDYNKGNVWDHTFFDVHSALMARAYVDKPQVEFQASRNGAEKIVANLNATRKEDFENSDMEQLKYDVYHDVFMFWVGIAIKTGWDAVEKRSVFTTMDPQLFVPDPNANYHRNEYAFAGFQQSINVPSIMNDDNFFNQDELNPSTMDDGWPQEVKQDAHSRQGLADGWQTNDSHSPYSDVYYHFATFGETKALVVTGNNNTVIIQVKVFEAVLKTEKADASLIPFPLTFTYWKPRRNSPFGDRVADFTVNTQRAKALINNLRLKKEQAELYPMYVYNSRLIKNRADLEFGFNKHIAANPQNGESIQNAIAPIKRENRSDYSHNIDEGLDKQVEQSTGVGSLSGGTSPDRRETLGTNQIIQSNTDINLWLNAKILSWGEKQIVRIWLRGLVEHLKDWDKKIVNVTIAGWVSTLALVKKDFLEENVKIILDTTINRNVERQKQALAYANTFAQLQSIERPKIAQALTMRRILESNGVPLEDIASEVPPSPQEMLAAQENTLLLNGEFVDIRETDDDLTHMIIHKAWGDDMEALLHIQAHIDAYEAKWGEMANQSGLTEVNQGMINAQVAQNSSQVASQAAKQAN